MPPSAATISVPETLALLDGPFSNVGQGVSQRQYAIWLGSGVSRERVDDLGAVIKRVLTYLQSRVDPIDPHCRFNRALSDVLTLAELSAAEQAGVLLDRDVDDWPSLPIILRRLANRYAVLLDVMVTGEREDFLLWDVVDVRTTFATMTPDCEHLCIAILAMEGVVQEIASGNWDGLVEAAVCELDGSCDSTLRICVLPEDFRELPLRARLLKFHGCAIRAATDPGTYRPLLIGRQSQITAWPNAPDWAAMKNELLALAVTKPTLMIGLSAQDSNIQHIFSAAHATKAWPWPSNPPAHVFAEENLGQFQRNILHVVYHDAYEANSHAIEEGARFPAFAKPLLTSLVLYIWCAKLQAYVHVVDAPGLNASDRALMGTGIKMLRDRVAETARTMSSLDFVRTFIDGTGRALTLFREGRPPAIGAPSYRPLSSEPVQQIKNEPTLSTSGVREMAAALGLLGLGEYEGSWTISKGDSSVANAGVISIEKPAGSGPTRVFFAANTQAALRLFANGYVASDDPDAVVIHSTSPTPMMVRSPRRAPGRTGKIKIREVDMNKVLSEAVAINDLRHRFRIEAAI